MKLAIIAAAVDDGTRTIFNAFSRELRADSELLITASSRKMSLGDWMKLRSNVLEVTRTADTVVCLNHGALIVGALLLKRSRHKRIIGIGDWTRQFPSRRTDWRTLVYAHILRRLLNRFDAVCSPVSSMREFYADQIPMLPIKYPLPYPEISPNTAQDSRGAKPNALFIGADIKRKSGDVLLQLWNESPPAGATLTFVTPETPPGNWENVKFHNDIKPFTEAHREVLAGNSVFILASQREAYGFAALEALNFGLIVVTTEAAGISELVHAAGGIVAPTPKEAIRQALELLNNSDELLGRQRLCRDYMSGYQNNFRNLMDRALGCH